MTMNKNVGSQAGSVLIYILIAVALFAALGYAVAGMMRGGGNIGTEKDGIYASEIMNYGRSLREGVQAIKISNGCDDSQISFERSPFDGTDTIYLNSAAPSDFSCHVFHPDGGGIGNQEDFDGKSWRYTSAFDVKDVGTSAPDLVATIPVNRTICEMINTRGGVSNDALQGLIKMHDGSDFGNILPAFQGVYSGSAQLGLSVYEGKMGGCYLSETSVGADFTAYQVLVAR